MGVFVKGSNLVKMQDAKGVTAGDAARDAASRDNMFSTAAAGLLPSRVAPHSHWLARAIM